MKRKPFATRTRVKPLKSRATDEARISVAITRVLVSCKCKESTSLQVSCNRFNGTITIMVSNGCDTGQYTIYLD